MYLYQLHAPCLCMGRTWEDVDSEKGIPCPWYIIELATEAEFHGEGPAWGS